MKSLQTLSKLYFWLPEERNKLPWAWLQLCNRKVNSVWMAMEFNSPGLKLWVAEVPKGNSLHQEPPHFSTLLLSTSTEICRAPLTSVCRETEKFLSKTLLWNSFKGKSSISSNNMNNSWYFFKLSSAIHILWPFW